MKKEWTPVHIIALTDSESSPGNFALILEEEGNELRLPIIIGKFEAQAIAIHLERMKPLRPLTHDLTKNLIEALSGDLKEVRIHKFDGETFHSQLLLVQNKDEKLVDSRTSDAIALAIRFQCPIYINPKILEEQGLKLSDEPEKDINNRYDAYGLNELEDLLSEFLGKEDYENASKIRDAISRRRGDRE